jgi:hypothetical protein
MAVELRLLVPTPLKTKCFRVVFVGEARNATVHLKLTAVRASQRRRIVARNSACGLLK